MRPRNGAGDHVRVNLADKIVMRPVGALVPYASNSRTHTPAQLDKLARSISEFGFTNPILVVRCAAEPPPHRSDAGR